MWEAIASGVIGNLAGRAIGKVFGDDDDDSQVLQRIRNENLQREFAQHGIRWRVEDAQGAGVHPLFALSGGGAAFAPNPITVGAGSGSMQSMGQDISRAVMATANNKERELREKLLQAQIDHTNAQTHKLLNPVQAAPFPATAFETGYPGLEGQDFRVVSESPVVQVRPGAEMSVPGAFDVVNPKSAPQVSARSGAPYIAAGVNPGSTEYRLTNNMAVLLPQANSMGESLEPLSESILQAYVWFKINQNHYGTHFADLAFQELGFPKLLLDTFKGVQGWSDFMDLKKGVRYTGPGNPLLPKIPAMVHPFRR